MRRSSGLAPKLALLSALLVSIPVAAWLYFSHEVPQFALESRSEALDLAARAVSTVLHDRPKLFRVEGAEPARLDKCPPLELTGRMRRDGSASDWNDLADRPCPLAILRGDRPASQAPFAVDLALGRTRKHLWAFFRVEDADFHPRNPRYASLDRSDHVQITLPGPDGVLRYYAVLLEEGGSLSVYAVESTRRYSLGDGQPVNFIDGRWQPTNAPAGYRVELSLRLADFPDRIGFAVADVDTDAGEVARLVGTASPSALANRAGLPAMDEKTEDELARLVFLPAPELKAILDGLRLENARIQVIDLLGHVRTPFDAGIGRIPAHERQRLIAEARSAESPGAGGAPRVGPYLGEAMAAAAAPIWLDGHVGGVVLIEQSNLQTLTAREERLSEFFLAILLACLFVGTLLSLFAARLGWRIHRLRDEAAGAIDAVGRVQTQEITTAARARDEVGDLSRTLSELLGRLGAYTRFREEIPRVLRHEINNPLNTLSLSLQNLGSEDPDLKANPYVQSAERGVRRIHEIIETVTEAANLEQTLGEEALEPMDLAALVDDYCRSCVLNFNDRFNNRRFRVIGTEEPAWVRGSDLHIERLLDKLIDNAVEFSEPGSEIEVALEKRGANLRLTVSNAGPTLSPEELEKVFDAMFSNHPAEAEATPGQAGTPHLGIGLYIVRLIAESMGGRSFARNRAAGDGVRGGVDGVGAVAGVNGVAGANGVNGLAGVEVGIEVPAGEAGE